MFNVCPTCGEYRPERVVKAEEGVAICPCGDVQPFTPGPLFVVGGPSGTGKSTILNRIGRRELPVVPLDGDILWDERFRDRVDEYSELCLRLAKNVSMAGKPVMLFAAGLVVPSNLESCVERRYFDSLHRLVLVCDDEALIERLKRRPNWRRSSDPEVLETQLEFGRAMRAMAEEEGIEIVDTTSISVDEAAEQLMGWVERKLGASSS